MYKIIKGGATLGYVESPTYVAKLDNGDYGLADAADATALAFGDERYAIAGRANPDNLETVTMVEIDGGALLNEQAAQLQAASDELTSTQLALCEVYELLTGGAL